MATIDKSDPIEKLRASIANKQRLPGCLTLIVAFSIGVAIGPFVRGQFLQPTAIGLNGS